MSKSNVELSRRYIQAFNARDIEAFIAFCDPSIEFHSTVAVVSGAVYRGHDGLRTWHRDYEDAWGDQIHFEPEAYFDLGEYTLILRVLRSRGRHSGVELARPGAHVLRWRDGLVVYAKSYASREDALSDLGVSEDELKLVEP